MNGTWFRSLSLICCVGIAFSTVAQTPSINSNKLPERVDEYLRPYLAVKDFSGVVLIAQGDTILAEKAYGMADFERRVPNRIDTAFRIASLSKTFTAAAISMLIEQGKVHLGDSLNPYIPDFPNGAKITVKDLLLHQSGVGQLDAPEVMRNSVSTKELVERIAKTTPLFAPGTNAQYSNEGYVLLAAIIEKASGATYESFLRENIFKLLGMHHTGTMCTTWPVSRHSQGNISGMGSRTARLPFNEAGWNGPGSVYSTAGDLYLWLKAAANNRLFHFDQLAYPYGWGKRNYSGRKLVEQSGELRGFNAHMALYPQEKLYFVFLSNIESGLFNRLPKDFEALIFGGQISAPPVAVEMRAAAEDLKDYVGTYTTPSVPVPMELVIKDNHLWMRWGQDPFLRPIVRTGKDEFFFRSEYASVHFERDAKGRIDKAMWKWGDGQPLTLTKRLLSFG
jgi:CubicO group peptidase (beta-lactamase class C family)